jgi:hypothetical protein
MAVESEEFTELGDEFALVAQTAAEAGAGGGLPRVRRGWVNVPAGGGWTNGLLRPARHRVVAGGVTTRRSVAIFYHPGLEQVLEPLAPFVEPGEETDYEPVTQWELAKDGVENYLKVFGRPAQITAWREGKPYVAELAENSAGR